MRRNLAMAVLAALSMLASGARAAGPEWVDVPAGGVTLKAALYRPTGAGPFPAIVALHGCGGLTDRAGVLNLRHSDWGERLAAAGFLVLLPDSFGSRGLGSQCRNGERTVRPGRERTADAAAAHAWLAARADVKPAAINLMGWSNGGSTVLYASAALPGFARAVAFYPGCRLPAQRGLVPRPPMLILVGAADDWTGAAPCEAFASQAKAKGASVEVVAYPGAYHDFDHPDLQVRVRKGLAYAVSGDGTAHVGTDPTARADALARVPAFLAR